MMQPLLNSLASAGNYLLVALGFSLIYSCAKFFHFTHGIILTCGAYMMFALHIWGGLPIPIAVIGGIAFSALIGISLEFGIFKVIRRNGGSSSANLLASLGIYVLLQAIVTMIFGSGTQTIRAGYVFPAYSFGGAQVSAVQLLFIFTGPSFAMCLASILRLTKIGKEIRAVASDPELAEIYGIHQEKVLSVVYAIGSGFAAVAGILQALDTDLTPMMGFRPLLMGVIAMIVGGTGSISGAILGALFVGLLQHMSAWLISSAWQDAIVFMAMIFFLLFRPQGFLGQPIRKKSV